MSERLVKVIDKHSDQFPEWIDTVNEHSSMFDYNKEFSNEEQIDLTNRAVEVLAKISELCFKFGAFRDKFDNSQMYVKIYGPDLIIKSTKTDNEFHLGIDNKGIYLSTYMRYSENLRYMDDSFYRDIFTLMDLGDFDLEESQFYSGQTSNRYRELYNNEKSKIFRLLRNYIVGMAENERDIILGDFHIQWNYKTDFYDIVSNCCLAFKILYKLNYSLWKIHDLEEKRR